MEEGPGFRGLRAQARPGTLLLPSRRRPSRLPRGGSAPRIVDEAEQAAAALDAEAASAGLWDLSRSLSVLIGLCGPTGPLPEPEPRPKWTGLCGTAGDPGADAQSTGPLAEPQSTPKELHRGPELCSAKDVANEQPRRTVEGAVDSTKYQPDSSPSGREPSRLVELPNIQPSVTSLCGNTEPWAGAVPAALARWPEPHLAPSPACAAEAHAASSQTLEQGPEAAGTAIAVWLSHPGGPIAVGPTPVPVAIEGSGAEKELLPAAPPRTRPSEHSHSERLKRLLQLSAPAGPDTSLEPPQAYPELVQQLLPEKTPEGVLAGFSAASEAYSTSFEALRRSAGQALQQLEWQQKRRCLESQASLLSRPPADQEESSEVAASTQQPPCQPPPPLDSHPTLQPPCQPLPLRVSHPTQQAPCLPPPPRDSHPAAPEGQAGHHLCSQPQSHLAHKEGPPSQPLYSHAAGPPGHLTVPPLAAAEGQAMPPLFSHQAVQPGSLRSHPEARRHGQPAPPLCSDEAPGALGGEGHPGFQPAPPLGSHPAAAEAPRHTVAALQPAAAAAPAPGHPAATASPRPPRPLPPEESSSMECSPDPRQPADRVAAVSAAPELKDPAPAPRPPADRVAAVSAAPERRGFAPPDGPALGPIPAASAAPERRGPAPPDGLAGVPAASPFRAPMAFSKLLGFRDRLRAHRQSLALLPAPGASQRPLLDGPDTSSRLEPHPAAFSCHEIIEPGDGKEGVLLGSQNLLSEENSTLRPDKEKSCDVAVPVASSTKQQAPQRAETTRSPSPAGQALRAAMHQKLMGVASQVQEKTAPAPMAIAVADFEGLGPLTRTLSKDKTAPAPQAIAAAEFECAGPFKRPLSPTKHLRQGRAAAELQGGGPHEITHSHAEPMAAGAAAPTPPQPQTQPTNGHGGLPPAVMGSTAPAGQQTEGLRPAGAGPWLSPKRKMQPGDPAAPQGPEEPLERPLKLPAHWQGAAPALAVESPSLPVQQHSSLESLKLPAAAPSSIPMLAVESPSPPVQPATVHTPSPAGQPPVQPAAVYTPSPAGLLAVQRHVEPAAVHSPSPGGLTSPPAAVRLFPSPPPQPGPPKHFAAAEPTPSLPPPRQPGPGKHFFAAAEPTPFCRKAGSLSGKRAAPAAEEDLQDVKKVKSSAFPEPAVQQEPNFGEPVGADSSILILEVRDLHQGGQARVRLRNAKPFRKLMQASATALGLGDMQLLCFSVLGRKVLEEQTGLSLQLQSGAEVKVCKSSACAACMGAQREHGALLPPAPPAAAKEPRGPEKVRPTRLQSGLSWKQYRQAKLPALLAQLEARWERISADPSTLRLIAWRHGLDPGPDEEDTKELGEQLDQMIEEMAASAPPETPVSPPGGAEERPEESEILQQLRSAPLQQLLGKLGLSRAVLPSPLLVFLELHGIIGSRSLSPDAETVEVLQKWLQLSSVQLRALWSLVHHRAQAQEQLIAQYLGEAAPQERSSFGLFLEAQRVLDAERSRRSVQEDSSWVLKTQRAFCELPEAELQLWLRGDTPPWEVARAAPHRRSEVIPWSSWGGG